ncbi:MAG: hypothetical protein D6732_17525 [Methanobacteriota archaeon]|nr:MAG: hypothetical protein D6732_17525 [Euryarchaeota archaeon]
MAETFDLMDAVEISWRLFLFLTLGYILLRYVFPRIKPLQKIPLLRYLILPSNLSKRIFFVFSYSGALLLFIIILVIFPSLNHLNSTALAFQITLIFFFSSLLMSWGFERDVARPLQSVARQSAQFADKNLAAQVKLSETGTGEARKLVNANRQLANVFRTLISNMKETTNRLSEAAEELAAGSEEVSATTEEVTATIQNIADGAAEQVRQIQEISRIIKEIDELIDTSITQIAETSSITKDIAEQTNLISLNAAIEAARAGASGQGFGVVADQVRKLSVESKNAAAEIESTILQIGENIKSAVKRIDDAVNTIYGVAENTAASSEEASAAAEEQSASLQEITEHAQELSELADKSRAIIEEWRT